MRGIQFTNLDITHKKTTIIFLYGKVFLYLQSIYKTKMQNLTQITNTANISISIDSGIIVSCFIGGFIGLFGFISV